MKISIWWQIEAWDLDQGLWSGPFDQRYLGCISWIVWIVMKISGYKYDVYNLYNVYYLFIMIFWYMLITFLCHGISIQCRDPEDPASLIDIFLFTNVFACFIEPFVPHLKLREGKRAGIELRSKSRNHVLEDGAVLKYGYTPSHHPF